RGHRRGLPGGAAENRPSRPAAGAHRLDAETSAVFALGHPPSGLGRRGGGARAGRGAGGRSEVGGTFDLVVARAVAKLDALANWCLPLLRPGGRLVAMKGPDVAEELKEAAGALAAGG